MSNRKTLEPCEVTVRIANLTQHTATEEQRQAGVFDLTGEAHDVLKGLLTFEDIPDQDDLESHAEDIASLVLACECDAAMIGGAPFFMEPLARKLRENQITPLFAFSVRESVETTMPDGSVRKMAVFRHLGFVGS